MNRFKQNIFKNKAIRKRSSIKSLSANGSGFYESLGLNDQKDLAQGQAALRKTSFWSSRGPNDLLRHVRGRARELSEGVKQAPLKDGFLVLVPVLFLMAIFVGLLSLAHLGIWPSGFLGAILFCLLYGWAMYSWIVYTLHEVAGHGTAKHLPSSLSILMKNASRVFGTDPEYYAPRHILHHSKLGTPQDPTFSHAISWGPLWASLFPLLAPLFKEKPLRAHRGTEATPSLLFSLATALVVVGIEVWVALPLWGLWRALFVFLVGAPTVAAALDRIRETTEHHYCAAHPNLGAREVGQTFLGLVIAGGVWGQPYHLSHHLGPSLPWYQQKKLSRELYRLSREYPDSGLIVKSSAELLLIISNIFKSSWRNRNV